MSWVQRKAMGTRTNCIVYPGEDLKLKNRNPREGFTAELYRIYFSHIMVAESRLIPGVVATAIIVHSSHGVHCSAHASIVMRYAIDRQLE